MKRMLTWLAAILTWLPCAVIRAESPVLDWGAVVPAQMVIVASARPAVQALLPGNHWHSCPRCGTSWQHSEASYGNVAAHTCPGCGALVWAKSAGPRQTPRPALAPVLSFPQGMRGASNCPT